VLALHGWPQHWWSWRHVIEALDAEVRMLCPDLRGLGWSGVPEDDDYRKQRMADDAIALLDALGLDRVLLTGHDWGGWAAILAALTAPERFSGLLALSVGHPWVPPAAGLRHGWLLAYQLPLAAPFAGERVIRDGRYPRGMLRNGRRDGRRWTPEEEDAYVDVLREPAVAHASSKLYRDFLTRDMPATRSLARRRFAMPARLVIGSREPFRVFAAGFRGDVEVVDGAGHFLPEEAPRAVAERIRAMCG
jgi:pimeloyl-ACP methyl ester carboxylesterase